MDTLLILLFVPLMIPFISKFILHKTITWKEFAICIAITTVIGSITYSIGMYRDTLDFSTITGEVTEKERKKVSCEHSYRCNCYTTCSGSGENKVCTEHCSTCYEHSYDVSWYVHADVGSVEISRVDYRGMTEPPRWTKSIIGEPFTTSLTYKNYIMASPSSLFHEKEVYKNYDKLMVKEPQIYDYYRFYPVRSSQVNITKEQWEELNDVVLEYSKRWGVLKKARVVIYLVNTRDQMFAEALKARLLGGKFNEAVVVIGSTNYPKIDWVQVISWTDNQLFKVQLRDNLMSLGEVSPAIVPVIHEQVIRNFKVKNPKDFEYLKDEIEPSFTVLTIAFILSLLASIGSTILMHKEEFM